MRHLKAGMENFTRYCAVELARKFGIKVRVNAIAPGFFVTEQNRKAGFFFFFAVCESTLIK